MPRPDAGCIWTSFQSSGKRHLLLTGGRGRGKTTLLNALAALLAEGPLPGVTTWAEPGRGGPPQEDGSGARGGGVLRPARPGRPCSVFGARPCRLGDCRCLAALTPERVVERVERLIARPKP